VTTFGYDALARLDPVADWNNRQFGYNYNAANRLTHTRRDETTLEPIYNGVGDRVGQTEGVSTTNYALASRVQGLPGVINRKEWRGALPVERRPFDFAQGKPRLHSWPQYPALEPISDAGASQLHSNGDRRNE
jgi:hypothetical protein